MCQPPVRACGAHALGYSDGSCSKAMRGVFKRGLKALKRILAIGIHCAAETSGSKREMVAPVARTKFNDLLEQVSGLLDMAQTVDEFTIRKIEREAEILRTRGIDVAGGWVIAGYCAALQNSVPDVVKYARKAISAPNAEWVDYLRMSGALLEINATEDMRALVHEALVAYPNELHLRKLAASLLGRAGFLLDAAELEVREDDDLPSVREALQSRNFSDEDIAAPIRFARQWLRDNGVAVLFSRTWASDDSDDGPHVVYELGLATTDHERVSELEEGLFGALAEKAFPIEDSGFMVLMLAPNPEELKNNAD